MESNDTVREILEEDGALLVSFRSHAGYYRVPLADTALCERIRESLVSQKQILFTHDRDLMISSID